MAEVNVRLLIFAYAIVMLFLVSEIKAKDEEEYCKGNLKQLAI